MNDHRRYHLRGMRLLRAMLAVLLAVALPLTLPLTMSGCTSPAKFRPSTGAENFPPYEGEVRVLQNMPSADQFERIGVVVVEGVQLTAEEAMVDAVKRKAAANGADAVVMQGPVQVTRESDGGVKRTLAAWAIRLKR